MEALAREINGFLYLLSKKEESLSKLIVQMGVRRTLSNSFTPDPPFKKSSIDRSLDNIKQLGT